MVIQEIWKGYIIEVKRDYFSARISFEDSNLEIVRIKKTSIPEEERDMIYVGSELEMYISENNDCRTYHIINQDNLSDDDIQKLRKSDEQYLEIFEDLDVQELLKGYDRFVKDVSESINILISEEEDKI